jgi:hypothetical protein
MVGAVATMRDVDSRDPTALVTGTSVGKGATTLVRTATADQISETVDFETGHAGRIGAADASPVGAGSGVATESLVVVRAKGGAAAAGAGSLMATVVLLVARETILGGVGHGALRGGLAEMIGASIRRVAPVVGERRGVRPIGEIGRLTGAV